MINPVLNVNKAFRYQVEKCMYTTFGELTQTFIIATWSGKKGALPLIMFYEI